jgi:hypothetical protein
LVFTSFVKKKRQACPAFFIFLRYALKAGGQSGHDGVAHLGCGNGGITFGL